MSKPKTTNPFRSAPLKPDQHLLFRPQLKELLGGTSDSTLWGWMRTEGFPKPIELGPAGGRSTTVAWLADEVFDWIANRPRRQLGQHEFRGRRDETKLPPKPTRKRPPSATEGTAR